MRENADQQSASATRYSAKDVMSPTFRLECEKVEGNLPSARLYLQTFQRLGYEPEEWLEQPRNAWPLIATIFNDRVEMCPIHTSPFADRYLSPKHGRFSKVVWLHGAALEPPADLEGALAQLDSCLDSTIFDGPQRGLGLTRELDLLWKGLLAVKGAHTIVISEVDGVHLTPGEVTMGSSQTAELLKAFGRVLRKGRKLTREARLDVVRSDVLFQLDPLRFPKIQPVAQQLVEVWRASPKRSSALKSKERRENVRRVREELRELASEAPRELLKLRAEIETVTLQQMISTFKEKLSKELTESRWQKFFEDNKFVLSLLFAYPVEVLHTQFHARGSSLRGGGAEIGDFLLGTRGRALAIVEIKAPETRLLQQKPYRGDKTFGPSAELAGAVTQVLSQQSAMRELWGSHSANDPKLLQCGPEVIKCVVLAGRSPAEAGQLRSLEIFRNAYKDVEVITYDELLHKLEYLGQQLTQTSPQARPTIPI